MKVSILSIGDELIFGEIADTNAAYISGKLYDTGLKTQRHMTVGDDETEIIEAMRFLSERNDFVITTGGLGPTTDDVTAKSAAKATGARLVLDEEALQHVGRATCKLGGKLGLNEKQALLPAKSRIIPNPVGTACGFSLVLKGCTFFFLPGVPGEMTRMLDETVIPLLRGKGKRLALQTKVLTIFGPAEAELDAMIGDAVPPESGISVAYAVEFPEILVKIRGEGENKRLVEEQLAHATEQVRMRLRDYVVAENGETIDSVVAALFRKTGLTLSLAESCTGGLVAKRITDLAGSSAYFLEGAVTYSNEAKMRTLGVPPDLLDQHGAVSSATAIAMARGMRARTGTDIALAVTGIAGPDGGSAEKPVGTVYLALASRDGCRAKRYSFYGNREEIRLITSVTALDWLRRHMLPLG